jgi:hypothetical protein
MKTTNPKNFCTVGVLTLAVLLLTACASDTDVFSARSEKFTTRIYANGLKQFQLAYEKPVLSEQQRNASMNGMHHNHTREKLAEEIIKRLELKLKETGYCRQGYILSREFSTLSLEDLVIKGECVEGATDADRKAFPNIN